MEPESERLLLSIAETCHALGIGRSKVWELIGRGELPTVRIGTRIVRVPRTAIDKFIAEHTEAAQ